MRPGRTLIPTYLVLTTLFAQAAGGEGVRQPRPSEASAINAPRQKVLIPVFNPRCGVPMPTVEQYREVFADEAEATLACNNRPHSLNPSLIIR
jgi:hypothetical protein